MIVFCEMRALSSLPSSDGVYSFDSCCCIDPFLRAMKKSLSTRTIRSSRSSRPILVPARAARPARASCSCSASPPSPEPWKRGITSRIIEPTETRSSQKKKE